MSIQSVGLRAYSNALQNFTKAEQKITGAKASGAEKQQATEFSTMLKDSMTKVNDLQSERSSMTASFASGETQNVHELMIAMQKASLAMNMTAAVRNKAIEAYKELTRLQF